MFGPPIALTASSASVEGRFVLVERCLGLTLAVLIPIVLVLAQVFIN
jgi:hypothetical protein